MNLARTVLVLALGLAGGAAMAAGADPALVDPTRPPGAPVASAPATRAGPSAAPVPAPAWPELRSLRLAPRGESSALLDGQVMRIGERLGDATVVAIDAEGVVLRRGPAEHRLLLLPAGSRPVAQRAAAPGRACRGLERKSMTVSRLLAGLAVALVTHVHAAGQAPAAGSVGGSAVPAGRPGRRRGQVENRFDLAVNNAPAAQVFMQIGAGSGYNMLVSPEVSGNVTLALKDTTVLEAMEAMRDLYGYAWRVSGNRILVLPNTVQTRLFKINYLPGRREGASDIRVSSSSIAQGTSNGSAIGSPASSLPATGGGSGGGRSDDTAHVRTTSDADFWREVRASLISMVGVAEQRSVVLNPAAGVIVVRATPAELAPGRGLPEGDAAEHRTPGHARGQDRLGRAEPGRPVGRELGRVRQHRQQQAQHRHGGAGCGAGAQGHADQRRRQHHHRRRRPRGRRARSRLLRPGLPGLELRRDAELPRDAGQRAGAVEPAHRHAEQPEGGAQGRQRRALRDRHLDHHRHQHHGRDLDAEPDAAAVLQRASRSTSRRRSTTPAT